MTDADVNGLLEFYKQGRSSGGFEKGVRVALQRGDRVTADTLARLLRRDYPNSPQASELQQLMQPASAAPVARP